MRAPETIELKKGMALLTLVRLKEKRPMLSNFRDIFVRFSCHPFSSQFGFIRHPNRDSCAYGLALEAAWYAVPSLCRLKTAVPGRF
jgi:hypothetical protein